MSRRRPCIEYGIGPKSASVDGKEPTVEKKQSLSESSAHGNGDVYSIIAIPSSPGSDHRPARTPDERELACMGIVSKTSRYSESDRSIIYGCVANPCEEQTASLAGAPQESGPSPRDPTKK